MKIRNTFIIFVVSGFWHGANWTFIFWGGLNALYFLPLLLLQKNRRNINFENNNSFVKNVKTFAQIGITFSITVVAWVFFRSENISQAFEYLLKIPNRSLFTLPKIRPLYLFAFLFIIILIEWRGRFNKYAIEKFAFKKPILIRWGFYYLLILSMFIYGIKEQEFIYFQF